MAGPTFVDYANARTGSSPLSISWNSGSAPPNGYFLLAAVHAASAGTSITPPAGWNTYYNGDGGASGYQLDGLFWKAASSETVSESWTTSTAGNEIYVVLSSFSGCYTGSAPQIVGPQTYSSGTTATTGTQTPNWTNSLVIASFHGSNLVTGWSTPTGCTQTGIITFADKSVMMCYQNALSTLATTTGLAATISGSISTGALNCFQIVVAPNPIILPAITDTLSALSDSVTFPTITAPIALTDTASTLSDSITNTVTVAITFSNDALSALSDTISSLGPGQNFTFVETIYPVIDNFQLVVSGTSSSEFLGISEALQAINDTVVFNISTSITLSDTGPSVSDTLVRADTIPIVFVDGISPGLTDTATISFIANIVLVDSLPNLTDVMLISGQLIATINLSEYLAPTSDGFTLVLGLVQLANLGQEVFPFSAQTPSVTISNTPNVNRLQFFPFSPVIPPSVNTPSVTNPTQTTFPMTPEKGV
jgi:hypothetical protein